MQVLATLIYILAFLRKSLPKNSLALEHEVKPKEYPFVVSIEIKDDIFFPLCIGTIIGPNVVITVARCFHPNPLAIIHQLYVFAGTHYLSPNISTEQVVRRISHEISHPNYVYGDQKYDISLVYIDEPYNFDGHVNVKSLQIADDNFEEGDECDILAWSIDLKWNYNVENIPLNVENNRIYGPDNCYFMFRERILNDEFCSEKLTLYGNPCFLDAGSPVVCKNRLYGIALTNGNCSNPYKPNIFISIFSYYNFIVHEDERLGLGRAHIIPPSNLTPILFPYIIITYGYYEP